MLALALLFFSMKAAIEPRPASAATSVFINEIHYDNTGTDAGEAIEIAGPAGTDLTGWSIVLYNGSGGASYDTDALSGIIPDQQNGFGTVSLSYPVNGIQNGSPDGIALVNASNAVVQFLSYEGAFTAVGGPANGMTSTDIGVSEAGTELLGQSLRLSGSGQVYEDFTWNAPATASFGAVNTGQSFGAGVSLAINDVTVTEGNSGPVTASFTVTLSSGAHSGVTFDISTQDGSATTADNDYVAKTLLSQTIPGGSSTYIFDVTVNGDTNFEPNETFLVNVTNVLGANVSDGSGVGAITNDDCPPVAGDIVISQVYGGGGNSGATFTHDFIELFNQGPATVNLSGWSVQYISAGGTGTWAVTPLSGSIAPGGYYLIQEAQGAGGTTPLPTPDAIGTIAMAAGAGKVALSSSTTPFSGACPNCFVDLVGYGGANCFEGAGPTAATSNTTAALRKRGGCFDSDNNNIDFSIGPPNPRNTATPTRTCGFTPAAIHDIQGDGAVTPLLGQDVTTTGVVTGRKTNGFFIQETDASVDANPATSEAIFVFTSSAPAVAVGDAVMVRGTASEFFNLTQLDSSLPGDVTVNSGGSPLPAAVTLTTTILDPSGPLDQLERFEGMRLQAASLVSVAPTNEFGEIFTVLPGVPRPLREPGIEASLPLPPGSPCCVPRFDENPERIMVDTDGLAGSTRLNVTTGVTLSGVVGPLDFTFGDYKIDPETTPAATANITATPVPAPAADEFTVGSFNLENFFLTNSNFATRLTKASLAIRNVMRSPDIIGVEEVGDIATLTALADRLNADSGAPSPAYQAFLIESDDDTEQDIDVGFLVKTSRVTVVSVTQEGRDATYINPLNNQPEILNDRAPLVLRATIRSQQGLIFPVTVVVNHLRSLIDIDQDPGDGPRVREKRRKQAEFLANLLEGMQNENLVVVGDFNAFQFNDGYVDVMGTVRGDPTPADEVVLASDDLVSPNLISLVNLLPPEQRYSFVFEGNAQVLDHVLLNLRMLLNLRRFAYARNNADFPETLSSDATRSERLSDHDMPVTYFRLPPVIKPIPIVECVTINGNSFTARFGYLSANLYDVVIPLGPNNFFSPAPEDRGQPTLFRPGLQLNVFSATHSGNGTLTWNLNGLEATASRKSFRCRN
jgi:predicted extracellular nuclease